MAPAKNDTTHPDAVPPAMTPLGPHPSFIQVAKPYLFERTVQECMAATGANQLREDNCRLLGVTWIDNARKALHLPVRTFNTAVIYYHKFRLVHSDNEYNYLDAAAAALFTACKIEDTLKKSRDILCTAYNLKLPPAEHLSPDDSIFESHSRSIIGLERLMLESSGFDFRNRHPQKLLMKLTRNYGFEPGSKTARVAYGMSLDLYRTFAPLKQTSATMAFACLELAGRLVDDRSEDIESGRDYRLWATSRLEVMETMLDLLELYTHHRSSTSIGPDFPLDLFLTIRIPLNQEADSKRLPRFTYWKRRKSGSNGVRTSNGSKDSKEAPKDTPPPNPMTPTAAHAVKGKMGERGRDGTVRFILNPEQAREERATVAEYFKVEMEEYEVDE